jgi:hypothetical protein
MDWPAGYEWGDDPRIDWQLLHTGGEDARTARRLEFLRTGAPWPAETVIVTDQDGDQFQTTYSIERKQPGDPRSDL